MNRIRNFSFLAGALALAASAHAHITLEQPSAHAGSHFKANFKVGHGCGSSSLLLPATGGAHHHH